MGAAYLADVRPFVAQPGVSRCQQSFLLIRPRIPSNVRPQLIVPPLPALFADAPRERLGNGAPAALSMLLHKPAITHDITLYSFAAEFSVLMPSATTLRLHSNLSPRQ